jgi:hypothetical protein
MEVVMGYLKRIFLGLCGKWPRSLGALPAVLLTLAPGIADPLSPHTTLHVNLGPIPIDAYQSVNLNPYYNVPYVPGCATNVTVRACFQNVFAGLHSQGINGVRFMFYYCGGGWSTALLNCGAYNQTSLNPAWASNMAAFLQDIAGSGIQHVSIAPLIAGAWDGFAGYCPTPRDYSCGEWTGQYQFITGSLEPSQNDGIRWAIVHESCTDTDIPVFFYPAAPYAVRVWSSNEAGSPTGEWRYKYNNSYNCSPKNPYFAGWRNIESVWNSVLGSAYNAGLTVDEFDLFNEIELPERTVHMRMMYDNKHADTGNPAVLDVVNYYMQQYGYNYQRSSYSTAAASPSVDSFDCGSFFGDSARVLRQTEVTSALAGNIVGLPIGLTKTNELYCGGTPAPDMPTQPRGYDEPNIVDVHLGGEISASNTRVGFNAIRTFLNTFAPTNPPGWRGYNPNIYSSEVIIGETSNGIADPDNPGRGCEGGSVQGPSYVIGGYNASTLANTNSTVIRPWYNITNRCYRFATPPTLSPPYVPTP